MTEARFYNHSDDVDDDEDQAAGIKEEKEDEPN